MKYYTFQVICSFTMQYTFQDHEVGPDPDGGDDDVKPTGAAMGELEESTANLFSSWPGSG